MPYPSEDLYAKFGIARDTQQNVLRGKIRKIWLDYHPDSKTKKWENANPGLDSTEISKQFTQEFSKIYPLTEILFEPASRQEYDGHLRRQESGLRTSSVEEPNEKGPLLALPDVPHFVAEPNRFLYKNYDYNNEAEKLFFVLACLDREALISFLLMFSTHEWRKLCVTHPFFRDMFSAYRFALISYFLQRHPNKNIYHETNRTENIPSQYVYLFRHLTPYFYDNHKINNDYSPKIICDSLIELLLADESANEIRRKLKNAIMIVLRKNDPALLEGILLVLNVIKLKFKLPRNGTTCLVKNDYKNINAYNRIVDLNYIEMARLLNKFNVDLSFLACHIYKYKLHIPSDEDQERPNETSRFILSAITHHVNFIVGFVESTWISSENAYLILERIPFISSNERITVWVRPPASSLKTHQLALSINFFEFIVCQLRSSSGMAKNIIDELIMYSNFIDEIGSMNEMVLEKKLDYGIYNSYGDDSLASATTNILLSLLCYGANTAHSSEWLKGFVKSFLYRNPQKNLSFINLKYFWLFCVLPKEKQVQEELLQWLGANETWKVVAQGSHHVSSSKLKNALLFAKKELEKLTIDSCLELWWKQTQTATFWEKGSVECKLRVLKGMKANFSKWNHRQIADKIEEMMQALSAEAMVNVNSSSTSQTSTTTTIKRERNIDATLSSTTSTMYYQPPTKKQKTPTSSPLPSPLSTPEPYPALLTYESSRLFAVEPSLEERAIDVEKALELFDKPWTDEEAASFFDEQPVNETSCRL